MDKQSLFFTSLVAILATALMLIAIQFFAKKQKIKLEVEQKINTSYSIWLSSIMVAFFMFLRVALELVENTIEIIIYSKTIDNTFMAVIQRIAIFTGFTFVFTFLTYYIVHNLLKLSLGNRIVSLEIEKDNKGYFIIKGIILTLLVYSILTIFEHLLSWFMPVVETPFYH